MHDQADPVSVGPAKFELNRCNESPLRGEKPDFWPVSKSNTGSLIAASRHPAGNKTFYCICVGSILLSCSYSFDACTFVCYVLNEDYLLTYLLTYLLKKQMCGGMSGSICERP